MAVGKVAYFSHYVKVAKNKVITEDVQPTIMSAMLCAG